MLVDWGRWCIFGCAAGVRKHMAYAPLGPEHGTESWMYSDTASACKDDHGSRRKRHAQFMSYDLSDWIYLNTTPMQCATSPHRSQQASNGDTTMPSCSTNRSTFIEKLASRQRSYLSKVDAQIKYLLVVSGKSWVIIKRSQ